MITTAAHINRAKTPPAPVRPIWGLTPLRLHDRFWASKGVQVVRPGQAGVETKGPVLYLMMDASDLIIFDLAAPLRQLNLLKPRALRLRVVDRDEEDYRETVVVGPGRSLLAVERRYRAATRRTARVFLSPDPQLARRWAASADFRTARNALRTVRGRRYTVPIACAGVICDAEEPRNRARLTSAMLRAWRSPGSSLGSVYQYQPSVWVHESVRVEPGARIVGPVWIGAGNTIRTGQIIVGPRAMGDAPGAAPKPTPLSWDLSALPRWRLVPRLKPSPARQITKRLFDIVFSLAALGAALPIFPVVILAILLEDGWPPFFAHRRQTLRGREFPCYKFRTMCRGAERLKERARSANVCDGPQFHAKNDPRVLRVGRLLRRTHIDELPQLFNILVGHMSVVGPRPSPDGENQFCPAWREGRLSVRPGLTGLWQVKRTRAPENDFQEWVRYDLEYIQNECWRLDLWIIMQTFSAVLRSRE